MAQQEVYLVVSGTTRGVVVSGATRGVIVSGATRVVMVGGLTKGVVGTAKGRAEYFNE